TLYERSRDWHAAVETARQLEAAGAGSFASRIANYWCEIALEADARKQPDEAEAALRKAREAAPQAARPLVLSGQRLARQGRHEQAIQAWSELMAIQPAAFSLVAADFANSAVACQQQEHALVQLQALYARVPSVDALQAMTKLDNDAIARREKLVAHLQKQPSLSAALGLLQERLANGRPLANEEIERLQQAISTAAKPLQRYRCAACGFEGQHYFWQCPGCMSWDSYPPHRLEDQ
ncbi:MAG TPA: lipopolysaccharide assembly protein LapB, partial [Methylibium sp.]